MEESYGSESITILTEVEHIRRRHGMYIGDTSTPAGLHHMVYQVLRDIFESARSRDGSWLTVSLERDGSCIIEHNSDILDPVETCVERVKALYERYSCGSGALGSVAIVGALSERLCVTAWHHGIRLQQHYIRGVADGDWSHARDAHAPGFRMHFHPDRSLVGPFEFELPRIIERLRASTATLAGYRSSVIDRRNGQGAEFHFPNGVADLLLEASRGRDLVHSHPIHIRASAGKLRLEAAILWCARDDFGAWLPTENQIVSWVNTVQTCGGGTHVEGFLRALEQIRVHLDLGPLRPLVMLSVFMPWPRYRAPVKDALDSEQMRAFVHEYVLAELRVQLADDPAQLDSLRRS